MRSMSKLKSEISLIAIGACTVFAATPALAQNSADAGETASDNGNVIVVTGV